MTSIDINDIAGSISSPGCYFEVAGSAAASFDNATSIRTVLDDNAVITFVDPA